MLLPSVSDHYMSMFATLLQLIKDDAAVLPRKEPRYLWCSHRPPERLLEVVEIRLWDIFSSRWSSVMSHRIVTYVADVLAVFVVSSSDYTSIYKSVVLGCCNRPHQSSIGTIALHTSLHLCNNIVYDTSQITCAL